MNRIEALRESAARTTEIANEIMTNTRSEAEFREAFRARDVAFVESQGYDEEQLAELRYETMCGCNGNDSPYHTYFGVGDPMEDRDAWEAEVNDIFGDEGEWYYCEDDSIDSWAEALKDVKMQLPHLHEEFKFCYDVCASPEEYPQLVIEDYYKRGRAIFKEYFASINGLQMKGL